MIHKKCHFSAELLSLYGDIIVKIDESIKMLKGTQTLNDDRRRTENEARINPRVRDCH